MGKIVDSISEAFVVVLGALLIADCAGHFDDKEAAENTLKNKGYQVLEDLGHVNAWSRPDEFGGASHKFKVVSQDKDTSVVIVDGRKLHFTAR